MTNATPPAGIAVVYADLPIGGGIKRYSLELLAALQGMGQTARAVPVKGKEFNVLGRRVGGLLTYRVARAFTRGRQPVVHSTSPQILVKDSNVATLHDLVLLKWPDLFHMTAKHRSFEERDTARALELPVVIVPTAHVKRDIVERFGTDPGKIHVTHEGINREIFHPDPAGHPLLEKDRVNLLILGDLNPRKRVDLLIEAVAALDDPRLRIVHVGAWHGVQQFATELREKAKDLEARGQYVYGGKVSDTDLRRLYSSADLFVLPTLDEGFGFPPLEAMACGCNVLVSDIPPLRETMGDLATYAPLTAEGFTKGLEEALKRKRPAATLVDHAATFTWRRCAEQTLQAYAALAQ